MNAYYTGSMIEEDEEFFNLKTGRFDYDANKIFIGALLASFAFMLTFRLASYVNLVG